MNSSYNILETSMAEPISTHEESVFELEDRIQILRNGAEELLAIMHRQYGESDVRTSRAGEICDALQRLRWELERKSESASA